MSVRGLEKARGERSLETTAGNIKGLHMLRVACCVLRVACCVLRAACGVRRERPGRMHVTAATWTLRHGLWMPRNALSNPDKTDSAPYSVNRRSAISATR